MIDVVIKIDDMIEREALKRGDSLEWKEEFALGPGRVPVLVDSFGALDEDRWWDADEYAQATSSNYQRIC